MVRGKYYEMNRW